MENLLTDAQVTELYYGAVVWGIITIYFLPTIIARARGHHSRGSVLAINFFIGWTGIGWVSALALSLSGSPKTHVKKNDDGVIYKLDVLSRLKDKGHLSTKEFKKQKRNLLA